MNTEIAMGGLQFERPGNCGKLLENKIERDTELGTVDRESSQRKVRKVEEQKR